METTADIFNKQLQRLRLLLLTIPYETPFPHVTVLLTPIETMDKNLVLLSRSALSSPGEEVLGKKKTYLNSEMRSTWSLYIHPTRLVVQVFRQYEKHNMKKETEYHSIKIVCDTCFKYLVNEKKSLTTSVYLPCTLA